MIGPRSRRAAAIAFVCAAATGGAALAQTAAAPVGNFGGGAIGVPVRQSTVAKDMLLSIRASSKRRIGVDGQLYASCALGTITGDARLAGNGRFILRGRTTRRPLVGVRQTTSFVVRGKLTADGGEGTAYLTVRTRTKGRATRTCSSRTVRWNVRRGAAAASPPAAAADGATLYGLTSQRAARARRAIVLHTARGGRSIDRLAFGYRTACQRRRVVVADEVDITPEFDVAADGSFRQVERLRSTFADVVARTTITVRGQFDQAGGAAGRLSVVASYTNRRSGKRVDTCRTGTRTWSARP